MLKWIWRLLLIALIGWAGYAAYHYYRGGFHTLPDMPEGAFPLSFTNGLRAVMLDVPDERQTRRYLGLAAEVPFYLEDVWSFCHPPTEELQAEAASFIEERDMPGERFEALCTIDVDGEEVTRGIVTSVPDLTVER